MSWRFPHSEMRNTIPAVRWGSRPSSGIIEMTLYCRNRTLISFSLSSWDGRHFSTPSIWSSHVSASPSSRSWCSTFPPTPGRKSASPSPFSSRWLCSSSCSLKSFLQLPSLFHCSERCDCHLQRVRLIFAFQYLLFTMILVTFSVVVTIGKYPSGIISISRCHILMQEFSMSISALRPLTRWLPGSGKPSLTSSQSSCS